MSKHLHLAILRRLKEVVQSTRIISISANEIIAIDHTSLFVIHVYIMENWKQIPYLLHLSHVTKFGKSNYLASLIMHSLMDKGSLIFFKLASKLHPLVQME